MRRKTWKGYDYRLKKEVELPRTEWRELIEKSGRTSRADGDLLVHQNGNLIAEVYDREQ